MVWYVIYILWHYIIPPRIICKEPANQLSIYRLAAESSKRKRKTI
jgi:hypothetical protein